MSSRRRSASPRALYLELAALGIDLRTGEIPSLDLEAAEIARLMRLLRENWNELARVVTGEDGEDLQAVREEAEV